MKHIHIILLFLLISGLCHAIVLAQEGVMDSKIRQVNFMLCGRSFLLHGNKIIEYVDLKLNTTTIPYGREIHRLTIPEYLYLDYLQEPRLYFQNKQGIRVSYIECNKGKLYYKGVR